MSSKTEEDGPTISQKNKDRLLHLLASCGFVENTAHTANTFTPLNPMDLDKAYRELREFILDIETSEGSPEDQASIELEKAARQHERMEGLKK